MNSKEVFWEYCTGVVDAAIESSSTLTQFRFNDCRVMQKLSYDSIKNVYDHLESHFFNNKNIGLSFGGNNNGSSVCLYYLEKGFDDNYVNNADFSEDDFNSNVETVLKVCKELIATETGATKIRITELRLIPMLGFMWHHMYYKVKQQLANTGYTLTCIPTSWELNLK